MEKFKIFIFVLLTLWINSPMQGLDMGSEDMEDYLYQLIHSFDKQMGQELNLERGGRQVKMHKTKIKEIELDFNITRRATIEEARALHVLLMDKFLNVINSCDKIQPYLMKSPLTYKQVSIKIHFNGPFGRYWDGNVVYIYNISDSDSVLETGNHLYYRAADPFTQDLINLPTEPYEDAIRLAQVFPVQNPKFHETTEQEALIDQIFEIYTQELNKKYGLNCSSIGGKLTHGVEEIGAYFTVFHRATFEEARELELIAIEKLLSAINNNEKLKPYLLEYPFTSNRLRIRIDFRRKNYGCYYDGSMEYVAIESNQISHSRETLNPKGTKWEDMKFESEKERIFARESYQEALKNYQNSSTKGKFSCKSCRTCK